MSQTQPVIYVTSLMPPALEQRARVTAAILRISRSELVRRATEDYLTRLGVNLTQQQTGVANGNR